MLMSDFFSFTVTVRAPRPSRSRRWWACSAMASIASCCCSRLVRSVAKVDSTLICLASARSATGRSSMPRASWCSAGPIVAPRIVGYLGVGQRRQLPDRLDAEPMQLLLGHRPNPPEPAHRQRVEQQTFLGARHHPNAVGFGQTGGDLGDLLTRSGADRGGQPRLLAHLSPQRLAEPFDVARVGAGQLRGFAERLVEGQLLNDGQQAAHRLEHPPAGYPVHHHARR